MPCSLTKMWLALMFQYRPCLELLVIYYNTFVYKGKFWCLKRGEMAVFPGFLLQIYWWLIESKQPRICFNNSFNLLSILGVASFSLYTDPPLRFIFTYRLPYTKSFQRAVCGWYVVNFHFHVMLYFYDICKQLTSDINIFTMIHAIVLSVKQISWTICSKYLKAYHSTVRHICKIDLIRFNSISIYPFTITAVLLSCRAKWYTLPKFQ